MFDLWRRDTRGGRFRLLAAALGAVTVASALTITPAAADPVGAPVYRALAGGGSKTTEALMDALADVVTVNGQKVLASYDTTRSDLSSTITTKDPATTPGCTINRPSGDALGQGLLQYSMSMADNCLDFARLGGEPTRQTGSPIPNVTYLPYALDGITYLVGRFSPLHSATLADLRSIYTCAAGWTQYHPLLPIAGSQLRAEWLTALGISDDDVSAGKYPCVKDALSNGYPVRENESSVITSDDYAIVPYSIAAFAKDQWFVRLGNITGAPESDGRGPVVPNTATFPDGVGYTIRAQLQRDLSLAELTDLYQCRLTQIDGYTTTPLLPVASTVRTAWLKMTGITEDDMSAGRYPCIKTTNSIGGPIQPNDGSAQPQGNSVMPYSISEYIRQALQYENGVAVPDKRNALSLGGLAQGNGIVKRALALNTSYGRPLVHRLYNVIPAEKQRVSPWREIFTGGNSQICKNTALIETYGFTALPSEVCGGGDRLVTDPPPPTFRFRNNMSGKCLTVDGADTVVGALIVQLTCGTGTEQQWTWSGSTGRQLKNVHSGLCVSVGATNSSTSAQAFQTTCGSGGEQQWIQGVSTILSTEIYLKSGVSYCTDCVLGINGASQLDGGKAVAYPLRNYPEESWNPETVTSLDPGQDTTDATASATMMAAAAAPSEWVQVKYPNRLVDFRHGSCRFQGYWSNSSARPGSGPVGGAFLFVDGYVTGPKCAVTMQLQVVSYDFRILNTYSYDHYYDGSKPTSAGKNERWMFFGPILGGAYEPKIGNVVYLLNFTLKDQTTAPGLASVGQVWGPKANWCDSWRPPSSPPGCTT